MMMVREGQVEVGDGNHEWVRGPGGEGGVVGRGDILGWIE